jgi:hypothetical protein
VETLILFLHITDSQSPLVLRMVTHTKINKQMLISKKKKSQKRANGVAQGEGPEFKSQYRK